MALPDNRLTRPAPSYYHDGVDEWMRYLGPQPQQPIERELPTRLIADNGEDDRTRMFARGRQHYADDAPEDQEGDKFNALIKDMRGQYYDPSLKYRSDLK